MDILDILLEKKGTGLTTEETTAATEYGLAQVRQRRDYLLGLTDKYTSSDFPMTDSQKSAMITYRQALRDITEETIPVVDWKNGIVSNVTWPTHEFVSDFDFKSAGINLLSIGQTT
tara:strand:+ start:151 stop:498 length:348 start_codon:yes stop_codon:yes gene_type:complete